MKTKNIIIAIAALATGAAAGWFAGGVGESSFAKATEDKREGRASVAAKAIGRWTSCVDRKVMTTTP
jgi:Flp pilus assembly protein CpaB